jgi:hypothetical protein
LGNLRSDAQVLEEALVSAPELAPHTLDLLLGVHQLGGSFELVSSFHPLQQNNTGQNIPSIDDKKKCLFHS